MVLIIIMIIMVIQHITKSSKFFMYNYNYVTALVKWGKFDFEDIGLVRIKNKKIRFWG